LTGQDPKLPNSRRWYFTFVLSIDDTSFSNEYCLQK
jgi:hypothetical protein